HRQDVRRRPGHARLAPRLRPSSLGRRAQEAARHPRRTHRRLRHTTQAAEPHQTAPRRPTMIAWMLQCVVVSVLLTLAAMAAERLLRMWHKEARLAWAVAMGASLALPLIGLAQRAGWIPSFPLAASIAELPA